MEILMVILNILVNGANFLSPVALLDDKIVRANDGLLSEIENVSSQGSYLLPVTQSSLPIRNWSVQEPIINSKAAVSFDFNSEKFLYEKEINLRLPIASITKIMTAVAVLENLNLNDSIKISQEVISESYVPGASRELIAGEVLNAADLLKLMLIKSNNEAAYAFKEHASNSGVDLIFEMNRKAEELNMINTHFSDPAGLDDTNGFSTAEDLIKLVKYSLRYDLIHSILRTQEDTIFSEDNSIVHRLFSTNRLLNLIPDLITGKTGYTEKASGNMLVVTKSPNGGNVITVVLGTDDRFRETRELIDWVNRAYIWN